MKNLITIFVLGFVFNSFACMSPIVNVGKSIQLGYDSTTVTKYLGHIE